MNYLKQINNHQLVNQIMQDGKELSKNRKINILSVEFEEDPQFNEYEYYIHDVGFSLVHFLRWWKQLNQVSSVISNIPDFSHKKIKSGVKINGGEYLIYSLENYQIRLLSIYDRILQLINSVFHLCIDKSLVSHEIIVKNLKVSRTKVPNVLSPLKKFLSKYKELRNTIIHRHSESNIVLREIELYFGMLNSVKITTKLKQLQPTLLRQAVSLIGNEISGINDELSKLIPPILNELLINYNKQKEKLKLLI